MRASETSLSQGTCHHNPISISLPPGLHTCMIITLVKIWESQAMRTTSNTITNVLSHETVPADNPKSASNSLTNKPGSTHWNILLLLLITAVKLQIIFFNAPLFSIFTLQNTEIMKLIPVYLLFALSLDMLRHSWRLTNISLTGP